MPSHATQGIFTPDGLPVITLPISGLGPAQNMVCIPGGLRILTQ